MSGITADGERLTTWYSSEAPEWYTDPDQRNRRLDGLIEQAHEMLTRAIAEHIEADGRRHVATAVLFSGGNDSTVLAHLFRKVATHAIHANTTIGIETTREFVRVRCADWGLPLLEKFGGATYADLVLSQGFPGPAHHWKMYQRLKERALDAARRDLIANPYRERIVFLAGRRRTESARRTQRDIPEMERDGSAVWVSPLRNWTALDMNAYRKRFPDCPRNPVADLLHMSGECLCGAFAKPGELDEIGRWYPEVKEQIEALEQRVRAAGIPEPRCRWGWGADRRDRPSRTGPMCSSCVMEPMFEMDGAS